MTAKEHGRVPSRGAPREDVGRVVEMTRPDVIPIPLRADFTAHVHIPLDLTEREARKIAAVVLAYAVAESDAPESRSHD